MDPELFWRYLLDFATLYPGAVLCFVPALEFLRTPRRTLPLAAAVLTALIVADAALCACFRWNSNHFMLAELAIVFFLYRRLFAPKFSRRRAAFSFLTGVWLVEVSVLLALIFNARAELGNTLPVCLPSTALLALALAAALGAVYCLTAARWIARLLRAFPAERIWRVAWLPLALCTVCYVFFLPRDPSIVLCERVQSVAVLAVLVSLLLVFLLLYALYCGGHEYLARLKLTQENHLLAMESQRYQELRAYVEQTRVLRHDFRQHLHVICGLAETGRLEELKDYLRQYEGELSAPRPTICANAALDAIAGHYELLSRRAHIPVKWQIALPETLPLPEEELCMMLGNLLENALRASESLPEEERRIDVGAQMPSPAMLALSVENTYDPRPGATPAGEGIGLVSVKAVVQRYGGGMTVETDGGVFRVNILLSF